MDSRLEELRREVVAATEGMSAEQLNWHPQGKWCTAEVLEHLYLTYTGTIKGFERVLEAGKPLAARPTLKHRMSAMVVLHLNYLPEGRKAPANTVPRGLPVERVRAEVEGKIAAMDAVMRRCEERVGRGKVLDHPVLGPFSTAQWRKFHLVHGRHHVRQIMKLREAVGRGL